ncbi:hypothetical protein EN962_28335 [Mesorhizobium sp. M7A.F.Ca.CA.001.09.2.1]|nr:hypothetical protein A9K65_032455 [Mesorhizobium sp. WSM1497]RUU15325.1 hypothetical protein EOC84_32490 [Mesorhizobium sp. Primo-B]RUU34130.1 hypothetical protein EOC83_30290 [Mesorhizobium sp. Primo-A]RUX46151.1 hypothetical protein EOA22_34260 [Mesorhizobium sp. M7A.F.Ca.US.014.04.1.1]RUX70083.1 hypothetical protein EN990_32760 [Mesorhizobium sp. M7A.F.Ca.US.005.03.1.1]RUY18206.1 hypothetical protein EN991_04995 [Mesorhizobium sp. M7A.F.Ca.US.005.03.2.1]RUY21084.1 hypothetical protein E
MGCATSARSDVFEKGASKSGSLTLNGFFSVPSLMMAMPLARSDGRGHVFRRRTSARHPLGGTPASRWVDD